MKPFAQSRFVLSAALPADLPPVGPPELAFAGRSNVGKSSAINALLGRKGLARTSKTPGRTQTINFYELGGGERLVDLPGYGYARVPRAVREQWKALVGAYLESRDPVAVVVVMDARHPHTDLDAQLLGWLGERRTLLLLSKADKLPRAAQAATLQSARAWSPHVHLFSSVTRQGVDECRDLLAGWLQADRGNKKPPVKGI
ncbi:MAG TPA: ribosome biogenesis GTP-binding protein YihA/YsxC [Burkholderiales bacterium]|jgi:GTP-binding protein